MSDVAIFARWFLALGRNIVNTDGKTSFTLYFYIYTPTCVYFNYITNNMIPYDISDILYLSPFLLLLNSLFSVPLYFK